MSVNAAITVSIAPVSTSVRNWSGVSTKRPYRSADPALKPSGGRVGFTCDPTRRGRLRSGRSRRSLGRSDRLRRGDLHDLTAEPLVPGPEHEAPIFVT